MHGHAVDGLVVGQLAVRDVAPPLVLQQVVALQGRLEHEVVLRVLGVEQVLLEGQELLAVDAEETALCLGVARFGAVLELVAEQHLFAERPPDRHFPEHFIAVAVAAELFVGVYLPFWDVEREPSEEDEIYEVVLRALLVEDLLGREVDHARLGQQLLQCLDAALLEERMLLMEDDVADVDGGWVGVAELLLQLEEARLDLLLDVFGKLALVADQLRLGRHAAAAHGIVRGLGPALVPDRRLVLLRLVTW